MKIVVLTGAGISAESGIKTFRDANGLWEGHDIMEVASLSGWQKNKNAVLKFYNQRRRQLELVQPNDGHLALKELESKHQVEIITQNVDDLHERALSSNILHLHGELKYACSSVDKSLRYLIGYKDIKPGDKCEKGSQLRPDIVWFGEPVPMMEAAIEATEQADILIVVGTSLEVYPAAGLLQFAPKSCSVIIMDPNRHQEKNTSNIRVIKNTAAKGLPELVKELL